MPRLSSQRLIGRETEIGRLREGFERARRGEPGFVLIAGEAGVGKTRLAREHASWVADSGGWVLSGACLRVGETSLPYGPFVDALGSAAGEEADAIRRAVDRTTIEHSLSRAAPASATPGVELAAQASLFAAVLRGFERLVADRPLLLVIDDLHWADTASCDLLAYLVHRLRASRIQTIAAYRSDALHRRHPLIPFLAEAERWPTMERLDLARLDREATAQLVEGILGRSPERAIVDRTWQRSDGNPFFVEELLATDEQAARPIGPTLQQVLDARLGALSETAQRVLGAAAVLGRRPEHALLEQLVAEPPDRLVATLRECIDARILVPLEHPTDPLTGMIRDRSASTGYEFRHALVQEAAYDELLPAERVRLHRRAANLLVERVDLAADVPATIAGAIAVHAERARDLPLALRAAVAAGRAAMAAFAFDEANRHYGLALELWDAVAPEGRPALELGDLLARSAQAAASANDPVAAVRVQLRRVDLAGEGDRAALPALLHELFWYQVEASAIEAFPAVAERAVAIVPGEPPTPARAIALADLGFARWSVSDHRAAARLAAEASEIARSVGDPAVEGSGSHVLAMALAGLGRTDEADGYFAAAADRFREAGDVDGLARNALWWSCQLEIGGSFDRALRIVEAGLEEARRSGIDLRHGAGLRAVIAENLVELGRWAEAEELIASSIDWGADTPSSSYLHDVGARILTRRGDFDGARRHLGAVGRIPALGPDRIWQLEEHLHLGYAVGDLDAARAALEEAISMAPDPTREAALWWSLCMALDGETDAALRSRTAGDTAAAAEGEARATRAADLLERSCRQAIDAGGTGPIVPAFIAWSRAQRGRLAGESDPNSWAEAVALRDALAAPYDAAVGRLRLAEAMLTTGTATDEVVPVLRAAHRAALALGAVPLGGSIDAIATASRISLSEATAVRIAPARASTDPHGLSARELEVLALVGAGRTNREIGEALFISPKTASVHVTHILDKLGVSSRVEAALIAARLGLGAAAAEAP